MTTLTAKNKAEQKLIDAVQAHLEGIRDRDRAICEEIEIDFDDPIADVRLCRIDGSIRLVYDGAGFDQFSPESDVPYLMADHGVSPSSWRPGIDKVAELVKPLGWGCESYDSCSATFWQD